MQRGVNLVPLFVDEIDAHSHIEVNVDLVRLVKLDARIFIFARRVVCIEPIVEEFGFHGDLRVEETQLVPRMEAVTLRLLELLVPLGRARWATLVLLARSLLRLGATLLVHLVVVMLLRPRL